MKESRRRINASKILTMLIISSLLLIATPQFAALPGGISGVSVGAGCNCHGAIASEDVIVHLDGLPDEFIAGETYLVNISFEGGPEASGENHGGFNLAASRGTFTVIDESVQIMDAAATHSESGNDQRSWQVEWTAPSSDKVSSQFTLLVNSVNGDGYATSEDKWNRLD